MDELAVVEMISHLYMGRHVNTGSIQVTTLPVWVSLQSSPWKGNGGRPLDQEPSKPPEASRHPQRNHQGLRSFPVGHVSSKILPTPIQSGTLEMQRSHFTTPPWLDTLLVRKPNGGISPKFCPPLLFWKIRRNKYLHIPQHTYYKSFKHETLDYATTHPSPNTILMITDRPKSRPFVPTWRGRPIPVHSTSC